MINEAIKLGNSLCLLIEQDIFMIYDKSIKQSLDDYDLDESLIYGVANLSPNTKLKCIEVKAIYAEKGYGPTLLLMAAAYSAKKGLVLDTTVGKVTDEAKAVWKEFIDGKGSSYVTHEDVEGDHKEDYLNTKIFSNTKVKINSYIKNSDNVIGNDPYGERKTMLLESGDYMLLNKMNAIYSSKQILKKFKDSMSSEDYENAVLVKPRLVSFQKSFKDKS